jgi:glycosyltransferase involved in cell wall biosynthesis
MIFACYGCRRNGGERTSRAKFNPALNLLDQNILMPDQLKIAVVTPYINQDESWLRQCQESVQSQTYPCTHIAVAEGNPNAIFSDARNTMHVVLPAPNKDFGNTPRALGAMLADSYGFDAVAFLDDDNWFEPNHLEAMAATHTASRAPLVACRRHFRHLDGSSLNVTEAAEDRLQHVDTNCWLICRPAFALLSRWLLPKIAAYGGDRIFFQSAVRQRYGIAGSTNRTVNYRTKHPSHYMQAGVDVPAGAYTIPQLKAQCAALADPAAIAEIVNAVGFYPRFS